MNKAGFNRSERLKSSQVITELFEKGKTLVSPPLRMNYLIQDAPAEGPVKAGFAVPKKVFKRATDRNLLKRRMREAYRLNKAVFDQEEKKFGSGLNLMVLYSSSEILDFQSIDNAMKILLNKLISKESGR